MAPALAVPGGYRSVGQPAQRPGSGVRPRLQHSLGVYRDVSAPGRLHPGAVPSDEYTRQEGVTGFDYTAVEAVPLGTVTGRKLHEDAAYSAVDDGLAAVFPRLCRDCRTDGSATKNDHLQRRSQDQWQNR